MHSYQVYKNRCIEFIKYDFNQLKFPLVLMGFVVCCVIGLVNKRKSFEIASSLYRTGWAGSFTLGKFFATKYVNDKQYASLILRQTLDALQPLPNTKRFMDDPEIIVDGILTVLKSPSDNEKGVVVLKYSVYFLILQKFYDMEAMLDDYILILEPSWAGLCETGILSYALQRHDVYVMCYEKRDFELISQLKSNLQPLSVGPSWFVDHKRFQVKDIDRDIDAIMVASWARFKRHEQFLIALKRLKTLKPDMKVCLVGYPVELTKEDIQQLIEKYELADNITVYDSIPHDQVCDLLNRSKVNVLWSKFEGNNRAIIEGLFCNTTVILRKGHNYGEHYDFINPSTGVFADESDLAEKMLSLVESYQTYKPRQYVLEHRNCEMATQIMQAAIKPRELANGREWTRDLEVKVNGLDRMWYFNPEDAEKFEPDNDRLRSLVVQPVSATSR